jgi:parallel beta-helix repeat protein
MSRGLLAGSITFLGAAILIGSAMVSHAGPLDPPAGPVAPSYKTLNEVEPRIAVNAVNTPGDGDCLFKITAPGSYYLTGNIQGVSGKGGIRIMAPNVTLDLGGFHLSGAAGSRSGVLAFGNCVTIRNGTVKQWGGEGVITNDQSIIEDIQVLNNIGDSIYGSTVTQIRNCTVFGGSARGILAFTGSEISNCSVSSCVGVGIEVIGATVSHCQSAENGMGFRVYGYSSILNCNAQENKGDGFRIEGRCIVRGNLSSANGTAGIGIGIRVDDTDCTIEHNVCVMNDYGISVEDVGNIITNNRCSGNTTNFDIVAGNRYGPIMNLTVQNGVAAVGNTAPTNLNTTDPWANFAY